MTLFDTSSAKARRNRFRRYQYLLSGTVVVWLVLTGMLFYFSDRPSEDRVNQFFAALEVHDYSRAYGLWNNDPGWAQHPERYASAEYGYKRFLADWGPSGDYGVIHSHKILYSRSKRGNIVLMAVAVNGRTAQPAILSVGKMDHQIGFSPFDLTPRKDLFGFTYWQISYR